MFSRKEQNELDLEMARVFRALKNETVGTQEYVKILDILSKLSHMKEDNKPSEISKDTLATIGANLLGILMILKYEDVNVITSRAFGLIWRLKN